MKRFTSILLAVTMLITLVPTFALAENTETIDYLALTEEEIKNLSAQEYAEWKNQKGLSGQVSLFSNESSSQSSSTGYIRNDYIEAFIGNDGKYTMGTTGGNPDSNTDNNKLLLFGHPSPWSSETLIQIDGEDYFFSSNDNVFSNDGKKCTSTATIDGVTIKQILTLQNNAYTQRADVIEIKYEITNNSGSSKNIGGRIMLDTMLGDNDGAPFKIPGIGDVTTEAQYVGDQIPQYWQSFDNLTNPSVISSGTFYKTLAQRPDMVQFAYWGDISGSDWDYRVDSNQSLTGDSAVAAYYNPTTVANGATKSFATYYGLSDFSFGDITGEVAMQVSAPTALEKNAEGTAYNDNPFTVTAYVTNQTADTINDLSVTLNIPSEFVLGEGVSATKQTGTITTGQEKSISWQVWAKPQSNRKTINYSISASGSGINKNIPMTMTLPAVSYYDVSGISLNKTHLSLQKGKSEKLIAYLNTQNGRQEARKYEVRWSSSNPSVVSVDANGNVKALKSGTATIKAITADYKMYKTCAVTVRTRPTTDLDLLGLSNLVYKNLDSQASSKKKISDFIDSKYTTEKFFNGTITLNEYYKSNLGEFKVEGTARNSSQGFYAASFLDCNDGIVIAYRGSHEIKKVLDKDYPGAWWNDWVETNAVMGLGGLPIQFADAYNFYNEVKGRHPNKKIILTGHSLGGALATFVSIMTGEEAVTFNGAGGFILDNTYFMLSKVIDNFNGIDNWNFKNHYNSDDASVGAIKSGLYRTIEHYDNNLANGTHDMFSLLKKDSTGNVSLSNGTTNHWYSYSPWIQELDIGSGELEDEFNNGWFGLLPSVPQGRVFLGTKSNSIKTMTAPQNLFELRENVFFSGGSSIMTGNGSSPDTFVFKSGDTMYGKGDDDTYITYETENFSAEIDDSSGNDKVIFKNLAMSDLDGHIYDGENTYRINTGDGHQVWINKRTWPRSQIKVVDKYGVEKSVSDICERRERSISLMSLRETTESKITTLFIEGKNINLDILDSEKNVLGTYSNANSEVFTTEYAYVYTSNAEGTENIEIELLDSNLYVRVNDGENVKLSALYGAVDEADSEVFTANIDLVSNEAALIDGNSESTNKFMYINGDVETAVAVEELAKASAIIPTLASDTSTFALRTATVDNIDIYAGETVNIELTFEPENVALDDVTVELLDDNNVALVSTMDNKIVVKGISAGTNTLKITALDGSETTISIPVTVRQDLIEDAVLTSNGSEYVENTWSDYPVVIAATVPEGYDTLVYEVEGDVYQNVDSITVDSEGETLVRVYAKNNESGRVTDTKSYELKIDLSAPAFDGIEDEGVYYIDKLIDATDANLGTISVNSTEFTADEYINGKWINVAGNYTIVATDLSGKRTEAEIEFKAIPEVEELTIGDEELIVNIRNAFEDVKYDLDENRRELLDSTIYELENRISYLKNPDNASNSILAFSIEGQIGEAYINEDLSTIQIEVAPAAIETEKTAIMSISEGATISPKPYVAQDFSNTVTYTVTAANGTERTWIVTASLPADTTAPQILDGSAVNNTITIEFDDHIGSITNEAGFTLTKQSRSISNNTISNISYYENIVNIEFNTPFDEMEMGEYSLSIASNSLSNISSVGNEDASYTFTLGSVEKVATPSANKSGQVTSGTQVTLSTATEGATIYYTVDGTEPTSSSTVYSSPITITSALTLKAIAIMDGMANSEVLTVAYTIKSEYRGSGGRGSSNKVVAPKANNSNKEVVKGTAISLSTTTKDAKIYYTLDGSTPTTDSALYTAPIVLNETTTIKMIAVKDKMTNSSVVTLTFNVRNASIKVKKDAAKLPYMALRNDGKFMPDEAATRYEIITALAELFDIEKTDVIKQFKDVDGENADLVTLFSGASIIEGYPDGTFGGEKGITRGEFVKILTVMLNLDKTIETTDDLGDIEGHWAKDYILRFVKQGYVKGYPDKTFRPDNNITRAEVVTIINRIIDAADKDVVISEDVSKNHWAYNEIKKAMIGNE